MIFSLKTLSFPSAESPRDLETLQTIVIFCGTGLLLSLLFAMNSWV
jgi:hypothetical protein